VSDSCCKKDPCVWVGDSYQNDLLLKQLVPTSNIKDILIEKVNSANLDLEDVAYLKNIAHFINSPFSDVFFNKEDAPPIKINHLDFFKDRVFYSPKDALTELKKYGGGLDGVLTIDTYRSILSSYQDNYRFQTPLDFLRFKTMVEIYLKEFEKNVNFVPDNQYFEILDKNVRISNKMLFGNNYDPVIIGHGENIQDALKYMTLSHGRVKNSDSIILSPEEFGQVRNYYLINSGYSVALSDIKMSDILAENYARIYHNEKELNSSDLIKKMTEHNYEIANKNVLFAVARYFLSDNVVTHDLFSSQDRLVKQYLSEAKKTSEELYSILDRLSISELRDIIYKSNDLTTVDKEYISNHLLNFKNGETINNNKFVLIMDCLIKSKIFTEGGAVNQYFSNNNAPFISREKVFASKINLDTSTYPYTIDVMWRDQGYIDGIDGKIYPHMWLAIYDHENKTVLVVGFGPKDRGSVTKDELERLGISDFGYTMKSFIYNVPGEVFLGQNRDLYFTKDPDGLVFRINSTREQGDLLKNIIKEDMKNPPPYGVVGAINCIYWVFEMLSRAGYVERNQLFGLFDNYNAEDHYLIKHLKFSIVSGELFKKVTTGGIDSIDVFENLNNKAIKRQCIGYVSLGNGNSERKILLDYSKECLNNSTNPLDFRIVEAVGPKNENIVKDWTMRDINLGDLK
jgi:hypothetical protein